MPSGRLFSTDSVIAASGATGVAVSSSGVPGSADLATVFISNAAGNTAAAGFIINMLCNDGVYRLVKTLVGQASAAITLPVAMTTGANDSFLISIPGPIYGLQVFLNGTAPNGGLYIEINLSEDRAQ